MQQCPHIVNHTDLDVSRSNKCVVQISNSGGSVDNKRGDGAVAKNLLCTIKNTRPWQLMLAQYMRNDVQHYEQPQFIHQIEPVMIEDDLNYIVVCS